MSSFEHTSLGEFDGILWLSWHQRLRSAEDAASWVCLLVPQRQQWPLISLCHLYTQATALRGAPFSLSWTPAQGVNPGGIINFRKLSSLFLKIRVSEPRGQLCSSCDQIRLLVSALGWKGQEARFGEDSPSANNSEIWMTKEQIILSAFLISSNWLFLRTVSLEVLMGPIRLKSKTPG